jgi:hypothetical protein
MLSDLTCEAQIVPPGWDCRFSFEQGTTTLGSYEERPDRSAIAQVYGTPHHDICLVATVVALTCRTFH